MKNIVNLNILLLTMLSLICIIENNNSFAVPPELTERERVVIRQEVYAKIQTAQGAVRNDEPIKALRLLFDAKIQEKTANIPMIAYHEIYDLVMFFIYQESNPLIKYLRNQNISILERAMLLDDLKTLVQQETLSQERRMTVQKYSGTLQEIAVTPELSSDEKHEIFNLLEGTLAESFVSDRERGQLIQQIRDDMKQSNIYLKTEQYIKAFQLFDEAARLSGLLRLGETSGIDVSYATSRAIESLVFSMPSPILEQLRRSKIPINEKRAIVADLKQVSKQKSGELPERFKNDGQDVIIQLLNSPFLSSELKFWIWCDIFDAVEKDMFKGLYNE